MLFRSVVGCTECGAKLKVAGASLGKKMKCPKCAAVFVAVAEGGTPPVRKAPPPDEPEEFEDPVPRTKGKPGKDGDADDPFTFGQQEANAKAAGEELFADDEDGPPKGKPKPGKKPAPEAFEDDDDAPRPKAKAKKTDPDDDEEDAPRPKGKAGRTSASTDDDKKPVYPSRLIVNFLVAIMMLGFIGVFGGLFFSEDFGKLIGVKGGLHADQIGIPKPLARNQKKLGFDKQEIEKMRVEENKKDLDKLEGAWVIDSVDIVLAFGAIANAQAFEKGDEFVFADDKLSTADHKDSAFTLDANETPKSLDFKTAKGSFSAIYRFDKDNANKLEWYMSFPQAVKKDDKLTFTPGERPASFDLAKKGGLIIKLVKKKDGAPDPVDNKDLVKLDGTWVVDSAMVQNKFDNELKGQKFIFADPNVTGPKLGDATYKIDATKNPAWIDIETAENGNLLGLYAGGGDIIKICLGIPGTEAKKAQRPKAIEPRQGTVFVLKREKTQDEPKKEKGKDTPQQTQAKMDTAKVQLKLLTDATQAYSLKNGEFPDTLKELTEGDPLFLENKALLIDPWNKPYQYDKAGPKNKGKSPDIWTVAPNKYLIGNWPGEDKTKDKDDPKKEKDTPEQTQAKVDAAKAQLTVLTRATQAYRIKNGEYPETLNELVEGKPSYLKNKDALIDPWKRMYHYQPSGEKNDGKRPDIWTETPDKQVIGNWSIEDKNKDKDKDKETANINGAWIIQSAIVNGKSAGLAGLSATENHENTKA